ncbi:histidine kinase [Pseudoduganella lurida]|uniref:histidine kinase n=1 Tax=Pseudoduganella lurida TaxID=1036180 RepID=A0A562RG41_9BURK|nr:histidine kinase [Pseudoduganella lurida]TWI67390.1 histidine kinase [Pseudoduganella lurida]
MIDIPLQRWTQYLTGAVAPEAVTTGSLAGQRSAAPGAEAWMVFGMRVLLAVSALLTLYIGPFGVLREGPWAWLIFVAYALHSVILLSVALRAGFWHGGVVYWIDIAWYGLMVFATGGARSPFFSFFFFAILAASFRRGFDYGARLTLGSAAAVIVATLCAHGLVNIQLLLLRATFVLGLGYMIAYWGGLAVDQRRRLALLRDVSFLSNPRFGVQHTLDSLMEKALRFYGGSTCVLLMQDAGGRWMLNTVHHPETGRAVSRNTMREDAVLPLLGLGDGAVLYHGLARRFVPARAVRLPAGQTGWCAIDPATCAGIADLLDTEFFISTALPLRKGSGRMFITAGHRLRRADATFLSHIVHQAFPVIETIDLLDRLASEAAFRERQTIARDLHDSTIQPYIGLRHAVAAIRSQAGDDNAVSPDLDRLTAMCTEVIADMRQFAHSFKNGRQQEPELLFALRRHLGKVSAFYDVEVTLDAATAPAINDRMAAEVFQIVSEGISNICKHTDARSATVALALDGSQLAIDIANPASRATAPFLPVSIAERVAAMGGQLAVDAGRYQTLLRIRVPI